MLLQEHRFWATPLAAHTVALLCWTHTLHVNTLGVWTTQSVAASAILLSTISLSQQDTRPRIDCSGCQHTHPAVWLGW